jgi:hypothetical protein
MRVMRDELCVPSPRLRRAFPHTRRPSRMMTQVSGSAERVAVGADE